MASNFHSRLLASPGVHGPRREVRCGPPLARPGGSLQTGWARAGSALPTSTGMSAVLLGWHQRPTSCRFLPSFFFFFNVYLFLRQSTSGLGAEREGDTESEAAPASELSAQSPTQGLSS